LPATNQWLSGFCVSECFLCDGLLRVCVWTFVCVEFVCVCVCVSVW
jgi:hypothetical protein